MHDWSNEYFIQDELKLLSKGLKTLKYQKRSRNFPSERRHVRPGMKKKKETIYEAKSTPNKNYEKVIKELKKKERSL